MHSLFEALGDARREAERAERLGAGPAVLEAWQSGTISAGQVGVITATIPDRHVDRFQLTAAETCAVVAPLSPSETRKALEHWVDRADDFAEREAAEAGIEASPSVPRREVWLSRTAGGVAVLRGELDRDAAAVTEHAIGLALRPDADGEHGSPAQRRADALVTIAQFYADSHTSVTSTRRQERLVVQCDIVTLYGSALRGRACAPPPSSTSSWPPVPTSAPWSGGSSSRATSTSCMADGSCRYPDRTVGTRLDGGDLGLIGFDVETGSWIVRPELPQTR